MINTIYVSHLQNVIADMSKEVDRATVKGKLKKPKIICCAFLTETLRPPKVFSLKTQKCDAFVINIFDMAKNTSKYSVKMVES